MIVVLAFCSKDIQQAKDWVTWVATLGKVDAPLLLVADAGTPFDECLKLKFSAQEAFASAELITSRVSVEGWPQGANSLFEAAADRCQREAAPFLFMEPDAIPLHSGWFDSIKAEYPGSGYMGCVYKCDSPGLPRTLMSGIAVYPPDTVRPLPNSQRAWDVDSAEIMVARGQHTTKIHHFWGQYALPPIFVPKKRRGSPVNSFDLNMIGGDARVFHRNKDGSLIRLLGLRHGFRKPTPLHAVFPVCHKDIGQALEHVRWMRHLGCIFDRMAVVVHDSMIPTHPLALFVNHLREVFTEVRTHEYPRPPVLAWPNACNWAFQRTASYMMILKQPWIWMEADMCVLSHRWLDDLEEEYFVAGKPFMGPHVKGMHHSNGGMIYPADAAFRMKVAMTATNMAWDYIAGPEIMDDCHDGSGLMQHCWTIMNNEVCEVGGGAEPREFSIEQANRWVRKDAVIFHRCKDVSLITHLRSGALKAND